MTCRQTYILVHTRDSAWPSLFLSYNSILAAGLKFEVGKEGIDSVPVRQSGVNGLVMWHDEETLQLRATSWDWLSPIIIAGLGLSVGLPVVVAGKRSLTLW